MSKNDSYYDKKNKIKYNYKKGTIVDYKSHTTYAENPIEKNENKIVKTKFRFNLSNSIKILFMVALIVLLSSFGVKGYIDSSYTAKEETTTITHSYLEEEIVTPYSEPLYDKSLIYYNKYLFNYFYQFVDDSTFWDFYSSTYLNDNILFAEAVSKTFEIITPINFSFEGVPVQILLISADPNHNLFYGFLYFDNDTIADAVGVAVIDNENGLTPLILLPLNMFGAFILNEYYFIGSIFHMLEGADYSGRISASMDNITDTAINTYNMYLSNYFGSTEFTNIKRVEKTYSYDVKNVNYDWNNKLTQLKSFKPLFNANITFINEDWVKIQNYITYTGTYTGNAPNQDIAQEVINKYYNDEKLLPLLNNNGTAYVNIAIKTTKLGIFKNDKQYYSYIEFLDSVDYSNSLISEAYNYAKDNYLSSYNESSYLTKYEFTFNDFLNLLSFPFQIVYNLIYNFGVFIRFITIW